MKTTINFKLIAVTVLTATIVTTGIFEAQGQNRNRDNRSDRASKNRSKQIIYDKAQRDIHRNDHKKRELKSYHDTKRDFKKPNSSSSYDRRTKSDRRGDYNSKSRNDRYSNRYNYSDHKKYDRKTKKHYQYDKNKGHNHAMNKYFDRNKHRKYYYKHPKYGMTFHKFYSSPFIFRHKHGSYYYYDGHFCQYRPGIGYVVTDIPFYTVFAHLPFRVDRVRIYGNVYYAYGNLFFQKNRHGFYLVPSPYEMSFSARF